jgi:hypothetical protein
VKKSRVCHWGIEVLRFQKWSLVVDACIWSKYGIIQVGNIEGQPLPSLIYQNHYLMDESTWKFRAPEARKEGTFDF